VISADNKRLYFASVGHGSIGGFDIFYSDWDTLTKQWLEPVNLGYPVNTTDDDVQISFTASGRYAYLAALRPEGYGNLDLYRIIFHDARPPYSIISGKLVAGDSTGIFDQYRAELKMAIDTLSIKLDSATRVLMQITDEQAASIEKQISQLKALMDQGPLIILTAYDSLTNQVFGTYRPDPRTGEYIMALPPGHYLVTASGEGYIDNRFAIRLEETEMPTHYPDHNLVLRK
jgi:hypothetical protein